MEVVYEDGNKGVISDEDAKNLFMEYRSSKEDWEELRDEMQKLGIKMYKDSLLSNLGVEYPANFVSFEYVCNRIATC